MSYSLCCVCLVGAVGCVVWQRFKSDSESFAVSLLPGERRRAAGNPYKKIKLSSADSGAKAVNKVTANVVRGRRSLVAKASTVLCCVGRGGGVRGDPRTFPARTTSSNLHKFLSFRRSVDFPSQHGQQGKERRSSKAFPPPLPVYKGNRRI